VKKVSITIVQDASFVYASVVVRILYVLIKFKNKDARLIEYEHFSVR
jgi:hypothetical protein